MAKRSVIAVVMAYSPEDLVTADRHIAEAERHIVQQEKVLTRYRVKGLPTGEAEQLLTTFRSSLQQHRDDRDAIAADLQR